MSDNTRLHSILSLLETEPTDVFLNYALAMEYMSLKNWNEAQHQLQKVISLDNNHIASFYQLGKVYEELNVLDKAKEIYSAGILLAEKQKNKKTLNELKEALWLLEED